MLFDQVIQLSRIQRHAVLVYLQLAYCGIELYHVAYRNFVLRYKPLAVR